MASTTTPVITDRVIPPGEEHARKAVGAAIAAGVVAYVALKGGLENSSPAGISGSLGFALLTFITGFQKTCSCTIKGGSRAGLKKPFALGAIARAVTPAQKALIGRKRKQFLTAMVVSGAAAAAITSGAYQAVGSFNKPVAIKSIKGSAIFIGTIVLSSLTFPFKKVKAI